MTIDDRAPIHSMSISARIPAGTISATVTRIRPGLVRITARVRAFEYRLAIDHASPTTIAVLLGEIGFDPDNDSVLFFQQLDAIIDALAA